MCADDPSFNSVQTSPSVMSQTPSSSDHTSYDSSKAGSTQPGEKDTLDVTEILQKALRDGLALRWNRYIVSDQNPRTLAGSQS